MSTCERSETAFTVYVSADSNSHVSTHKKNTEDNKVYSFVRAKLI